MLGQAEHLEQPLLEQEARVTRVQIAERMEQSLRLSRERLEDPWVTVTEQERAIIRRTAKSMNRTPSDLCRLAVMGILEQMRTGRRLAPSAPGGRQDDQA